MDYTTFNVYEAIFWISLGGMILIISQIAHWHARMVFMKAALWTTLFGLSDIAEVFFGELFRVDLWWLILWKGICIVGILRVIYLYLHLRVVIK